MPKVTLQSIADRVGVSRMTVSNAFSRPDQLSADLRQRILATAVELGYAGPNPSARALARGRTGSVGMLLNSSVSRSFDDAVSAGLLAAVADELTARGVALTLLTPPLTDEFYPARDVAVDGALIYSCNVESAGIGWLERRGVPMVTIDEHARPGVPAVNVDDRGGARAAAQHLVDLGHRRIAILSLQDAELPGPATDLSTVSQSYPTSSRMLGWRDALDAAGVVPVIRLAPLDPPTTARDVARELLASQDVTAVLCFSDVFAHAVIQAAGEVGRPVPGDVSVVGFDDNPLAVTLRPPLTTVHQDVATKGRVAAAALVARLDGEEPESALLPTQLVVRSSTAPPRDPSVLPRG